MDGACCRARLGSEDPLFSQAGFSRGPGGASLFTASLRSLDPRSPLTAPYQGLELYLPASHEPCLSEGHLQVTGRVEPETRGTFRLLPGAVPQLWTWMWPLSQSPLSFNTPV